MAKVYASRIKKAAVKSMGAKSIRDQAFKIVQKRLEQAHKETLTEFNTHPVTAEIEAGPRSENLSGTLGGYGNLFSYIGFGQGTNPTESLRDFLIKTPKVFKNSRFVKRQNSVEFMFRIQIPTTEQMEALSPSPYEGRSWVKGVERGISGLGYYLHSRSGQLAGSRSGHGIQTENRLRAMTFKPIRYMTSILTKFRKRVTG
jgi:hypothetical protein